MYEELDPKVILDRQAAEVRVMAQAAKHRAKFDRKSLQGNYVLRGRRISLLLTNGGLLEGTLQLASTERMAILETGKTSVTWVRNSDIADADF